MATDDSNDFWGKGTPSNQPPQDPNEGFWSGAKKKDAPKAEPPKAEPPPSPKSEEGGAFWGTGKSTLGSAMSQPTEPDKPADPSFWNKAEEKKKVKETQAALPEDVKKRAKKRRKRKIILISVGSVVLLFVLLIALAPTIAGWLALGIIESQGGQADERQGHRRVHQLRLVRFAARRGHPSARQGREGDCPPVSRGRGRAGSPGHGQARYRQRDSLGRQGGRRAICGWHDEHRKGDRAQRLRSSPRPQPSQRLRQRPHQRKRRSPIR